MTTEEIYERVKAENPDIGLATVYRTVQLLLELELIDRITVYSSSNIAVRLRFEDEYECMKEWLFPPMGVAASE